jgi:hypothetical protein
MLRASARHEVDACVFKSSHTVNLQKLPPEKRNTEQTEDRSVA